jgi:hypothetical protein
MSDKHKVKYFESRFSNEVLQDVDPWFLIDAILEERSVEYSKGFRVLDILTDEGKGETVVKFIDNSKESFTQSKIYFRNKNNENMGLINGYRATAKIDGDICTIKPHLGILFRPYDHYKVTKSGRLCGYWKPYDRNKPDEWGGFTKWEQLKWYRDELVQVPFRQFEVIESNDVLLKLKIL